MPKIRVRHDEPIWELLVPELGDPFVRSVPASGPPTFLCAHSVPLVAPCADCAAGPPAPVANVT